MRPSYPLKKNPEGYFLCYRSTAKARPWIVCVSTPGTHDLLSRGRHLVDRTERLGLGDIPQGGEAPLRNRQPLVVQGNLWRVNQLERDLIL